MKPNDQRLLDDRLAEFTDRLMTAGDEELSLAAQDRELRALQGTVLLLKRALVDQQPERAVAERIRARLVFEWNAAHAQAHRDARQEQSWPGRMLRGWRRQMTSRPRAFALSYVAVSLLMLLVVLILAPSIEAVVTGTAGGSGWAPFLMAFIVMMIFVVIWLVWFRR
jgi:sterol desaturase/sphingolipid hydroxylase (fatty acid hydroxylase superfamily)